MHKCMVSRPKSPLQWAPVEMMKVRLTRDVFGQRGTVVGLWKGCRAHVCNNRGQSGAVRKQVGRSGQVKQNKTRGGVLIAELTTYTEGLYILQCTR